jgi:hypothetical protein
MVARLLWQLRVWRMRVVAESGRDYRRSILVGSVLLLCELLLTAPADQLTPSVGRRLRPAPFLVPMRQLFADRAYKLIDCQRGGECF